MLMFISLRFYVFVFQCISVIYMFLLIKYFCVISFVINFLKLRKITKLQKNYKYLFLSSIKFSREQLKAFKSFQSYQYFVAGWARGIFVAFLPEAKGKYFCHPIRQKLFSPCLQRVIMCIQAQLKVSKEGVERNVIGRDLNRGEVL